MNLTEQKLREAIKSGIKTINEAKNNFRKMYPNSTDLEQDIVAWYKSLKKDMGEKYAKEMRADLVKALMNESKLTEAEDYKYKKEVGNAFDEINDAMFNFRHAMGVKQLTNKDMKLKKKFEALQANIFALQREMKSDGLTEAKSYNLDTQTDAEYDKIIGDAVKKLDGIKQYDKMASDYGKTAASSMSSLITITQYGKTDNTDALKKILKKIDSNLLVNTITNNFDATDNERSGNDKSKDIWKYTIDKKINYQDADKLGLLKFGDKNVTDMDHEVVVSLMDMMAAYTSEATPLADTQWRTLEDFMSAASDYITGSDWKKFQKDVEERYPVLESKLNEEGPIDYFYDEMSSEGIFVTIFDAEGDGRSVKAQFTKKKWDDGVPVTKHLTRGGYKDIKTPKGKFQLIESPTFWYYEINNGWAAVNKKEYGTPPFEY